MSARVPTWSFNTVINLQWHLKASPISSDEWNLWLRRVSKCIPKYRMMGVEGGSQNFLGGISLYFCKLGLHAKPNKLRRKNGYCLFEKAIWFEACIITTKRSYFHEIHYRLWLTQQRIRLQLNNYNKTIFAFSFL